MAEELIREIVSPEAFTQVKKLQTELKDTLSIFKEAMDGAKAFDAVLRGAKGLSQLEKALRDGKSAQEAFSAATETVKQKTKEIGDYEKAAADSLYAYQQQVRALEKEFKLLGSTEDRDIQRKKQIRKELIDLAKAHGGEKKALQDAKKAVDAADQSYYGLVQVTREMEKQLKSMPNAFDATTGAINKNNQEAVTLQAQVTANNKLLKQYDATLGQHFRNVGNYQSAFGKVGGLFNSFANNGNVRTVTSGLADYTRNLVGFTSAAFVAVQASRAIVNSNVEISDSLSEVQRVAGLTTPEVDDLYASIKKIDTRTSLSGLLDLSRIGAQLGVAKEDLTGFTTALNELSVVLEKEISGGPEKLAESLGKINNLLDINKTYGVEKGMEKTGSAILAVGQAGLATGDYLADFAERVGGVAKIAHVSLPDILAYGSALQGNGVNAELAGTSLTRLFTQMAKMPQAFYNVAKAANPKLTLQQFTDFINTDASKALNLFLQGLNKGGSKLTDFATITASLKLPGQRATQVLSALSTNLDDVAKFADIANDAFNDGTLIADQYALRNDNLAGSIERLKNEAIKLVTDPNSNLAKFFKGIVDDARFALKAIDYFIPKIQKVIETIKVGNIYFKTLSDTFSFSAAGKAADAYVQQKNAEKKAAEDLQKFEKSAAADRAKAIADQQKKVDELQKKVNASSQQDKSVLGAGAAFNGQMLPKTEILVRNLNKQEELLKRLKKVDAQIAAEENAKKPTGPKGPVTPINLDDSQSKAKARAAAAEAKAESREQIQIDKATRQARIKNAEAELQAEYQLEQQQLSQASKANQDIINDDQRSLEDRLGAFEKYIQSQKDLIESQKEQQIKAMEDTALNEALQLKQRQALLDARKKKGAPLTDEETDKVVETTTLTEKERTQVLADQTNKRKVIEQKAADDTVNLVSDTAKRLFNITKSSIAEQSNNNIDLIQVNADHQLSVLNSLYADRRISEKKFNDYKEQVNFETDQAILNDQIAAAKKQLDAAEQYGLDIADARRTLADLEKQLSDSTTEHIIGNEEKKRQAAENALNLISTYGGQIFNVVGQAIDNSVTAQKNALQQQIDAINEQKEAEIDAVNDSLLSQQEKADKIAVINAKSAAQTEQLARRQKQLDQQKAKFDKANSIFQIILSTASAIVEALPNIPLSILVGTIGAAQLAVAATAPIPQYYVGTDDAPGGYAIVSEQGPELMTLPSGKQMLTPDRPTIMYVPEHAKILPHNETLIEMARRQALASSFKTPFLNEDDFNRRYAAAMEGKLNELIGVVKSRPEHTTNFSWSERGVQKWVKSGSGQFVWINTAKH